MKKLLAAVAATAVSLICFAGCNNIDYSSESNFFFSMDTEADLIISDKFDKNKEKLFGEMCADINSALNGLNSSLSVSVQTSGIYKFNEAAAGATVEIDRNAYNVLTLAKDIYGLTDGYYNPAVYYSVYDYGFFGLSGFMTAQALPSDEKVDKNREIATHFSEVELTESDGKYYVKKPLATFDYDGATYSMKIDLGGIGKGYAVDRVNEIIEEYGFKYGYFSFGSSSILCKEHYKNGEYTLGFTNPRPETYGQAYSSTSIKNVCLSTSGDNEQYYEIDGTRYCHVIDPTTGKPVQTGIMTATVIGGSAAEGDALTTALMAMGKEKALEFIGSKLSDRKVLFTYDNNGSYEIFGNIPQTELTVTDKRFKFISGTEDVA